MGNNTISDAKQGSSQKVLRKYINIKKSDISIGLLMCSTFPTIIRTSNGLEPTTF
jgi:hypothetical protein